MHSRLVQTYAACVDHDLAPTTSLAASPCSFFPSHFLGVFSSFFRFSVCYLRLDSVIVDISSCPLGWTDLISSSVTKMELPRPPKGLPRTTQKWNCRYLFLDFFEAYLETIYSIDSAGGFMTMCSTPSTCNSRSTVIMHMLPPPSYPPFP